MRTRAVAGGSGAEKTGSEGTNSMTMMSVPLRRLTTRGTRTARDMARCRRLRARSDEAASRRRSSCRVRSAE